jgi:hypothetical protein
MKKIKELVAENNVNIQKNNQNNLRNLEQEFVDNKIMQMDDYIAAKKDTLVEELTKFAGEHTVPTKWDKDGIPIEYAVKVKPLVINNYFFKSICPINSVEPIYNAEKLGLVFDYYNYLLSEVNDKLGDYPSSLTGFCKVAGITLNTLRNYKNSDDMNLRIIAEKIYDQIGDENMTLGQLGMVKERTTLFKLRSQNEITEAQRPNVSINITDKIDTNIIEDRIGKYAKFIDKKSNKG